MRMRKEEQMRLEGMEQAVRILEANGGSIKALKEDIRRRGGRGIPIWVTKAMEREYSDRVKDNCMRTILLMSCSVLASEFEFGNRETNGKPGRMARFVKKFNQYCGDMLQGDIDWEVLQRELAHDTGIDLPVWFR